MKFSDRGKIIADVGRGEEGILYYVYNWIVSILWIRVILILILFHLSYTLFGIIFFFSFSCFQVSFQRILGSLVTLCYVSK